MTESNAAKVGRDDFVLALRGQRSFLRHTVNGLTDDQARQRTTVSELCLGGIIRHVATVEDGWARFIVEGASAIGGTDEAAMKAHAESFTFGDSETLEAVLAAYDETARRTEAIITGVPSLEDRHLLPEAPWFPPGASWSVRQVLLHILSETAQHCGHADIIRESLDGQKTMG